MSEHYSKDHSCGYRVILSHYGMKDAMQGVSVAQHKEYKIAINLISVLTVPSTFKKLPFCQV